MTISDSKEIIQTGDKELALYELETRFALAVRQRELLEKYIHDRLKPDKHYYRITDDPKRKPSLTKEGSELICLPHVLKPHYEWIAGPTQPPLDNTPYQITLRCILEANGKFGGEGLGSASSYITTRAGEYKPRQNDPGLCFNATVKMACKSSYTAATLSATAASEFFTQDLEDDQSGGDKGDAEEKQTPKEHWCEKHQTNWFKSPKMKSFAHPYEENGQTKWCSEPKAPSPVEAPEEAGQGNPPAPEPQAPLEATVERPGLDEKVRANAKQAERLFDQQAGDAPFGPATSAESADSRGQAKRGTTKVWPISEYQKKEIARLRERLGQPVAEIPSSMPAPEANALIENLLAELKQKGK